MKSSSTKNEMIKRMFKTAGFVACVTALCSTNAVMAGGDAAAGKEKSQVCASCHGEDGNTPTTPQYPRLAGQYQTYLEYALQEYKNGGRQNAIMAGFAGTLSKQDIRDLSAYYASQPGNLHTPPQTSW